MALLLLQLKIFQIFELNLVNSSIILDNFIDIQILKQNGNHTPDFSLW